MRVSVPVDEVRKYFRDSRKMTFSPAISRFQVFFCIIYEPLCDARMYGVVQTHLASRASGLPLGTTRSPGLEWLAGIVGPFANVSTGPGGNSTMDGGGSLLKRTSRRGSAGSNCVALRGPSLLDKTVQRAWAQPSSTRPGYSLGHTQRANLACVRFVLSGKIFPNDGW